MLATRVKQWEQELLQKGLEEGIEKGIEKGIEIGLEKGRLYGEAAMLRRQLQLRFGDLPTWVDERFEHATRVDLERCGQRFLDARSLPEVFA